MGKRREPKIEAPPVEVPSVEVPSEVSPPPGLQIESVQPVLDVLERYARWVIGDLPVTITPVLLSRGQKRRHCTGWTWAGIGITRGQPDGVQWETRNGKISMEVALAAEMLNRPPLEILQTMHHECTHCVANAKGEKDCAASGRHNAKFAANCAVTGLQVLGLDDAGKPVNKTAGYGQTAYRPETEAKVAELFQADLETLGLFRHVEIAKGRGGPWKYKCIHCDAIFRGSERWSEDPPAHCDARMIATAS